MTLPDGATRKALLQVLLRSVPTAGLDLDEIAERTPGFVVADLSEWYTVNRDPVRCKKHVRPIHEPHERIVVRVRNRS